MLYLSFWVRNTSLGMLFILVASICLQNFMMSFSFNSWITLHYVNVPQFSLSISGYYHTAAMNIGKQVYLWLDEASFGYMPKSGTTGSWDRLISNLPRKHPTDFLSGFTSLHSHQQWICVFLLFHILTSMSLTLLILAILIGVR